MGTQMKTETGHHGWLLGIGIGYSWSALLSRGIGNDGFTANKARLNINLELFLPLPLGVPRKGALRILITLPFSSTSNGVCTMPSTGEGAWEHGAGLGVAASRSFVN